MQLSARISLNNCRAARLCNCFCKTSAGGLSSSSECSLYTSSEVGTFVQHFRCILCVHRTLLFPMRERILFKRHGGCLCCVDVMLPEQFKLKGRHDLPLNEKKATRDINNWITTRIHRHASVCFHNNDTHTSQKGNDLVVPCTSTHNRDTESSPILMKLSKLRIKTNSLKKTSNLNTNANNILQGGVVCWKFK